MRCISLLIFIVSISYQILAQEPRKFGEVTKEEMQMTIYKNDSSAKAVILYDFGETVFNNSGIYFYTHRIVKIFEDDAFELANIIIPYPQGSSLRNMQAVTYNLENGEILKSEIDKKDVYTTLEIDGVSSKKFAMPDVKPGSIIEYEYKASLGSFLFLNSWNFQSKYPTKVSEYRVKLPITTEYKVLTRGYESVSRIDNKNYDYHFIARNVPAFVEEEFISSTKNFITSVSFELQSSYFMSFYSTFEEISKSLLENDFFGDKLDNTNFLKKEAELITSTYDSKYDQAKAIYNYVINKINFSGRHDFFAVLDYKKVLDGEKASSGDINLLLTSFYRTAGFDAWPVILSTRKNGMVHPVYPLINQYNHVICRIDIGDRFILVDATNKYIPFEVLPEKDLNGRGRIISKYNSGWIDLQGKGNRYSSISGEFILFEDGLLEGTLQHKLMGFTAAEARKDLANSGIDKVVDEIEETDGWEIFDIVYESQDDIYNPLVRNIDLAISNKTELTNNKIYLAPILSDQLVENPFKLEERKYPIDYASSQKQVMYYNITIPDNYSVEFIPEKSIIALPNNTGMFSYSVVNKNNVITIVVQFKIDQVLFDSKDYKILKRFYNQIIEIQSRNVILKKNT